MNFFSQYQKKALEAFSVLVKRNSTDPPILSVRSCQTEENALSCSSCYTHQRTAPFAFKELLSNNTSDHASIK